MTATILIKKMVRIEVLATEQSFNSYLWNGQVKLCRLW